MSSEKRNDHSDGETSRLTEDSSSQEDASTTAAPNVITSVVVATTTTTTTTTPITAEAEYNKTKHSVEPITPTTPTTSTSSSNINASSSSPVVNSESDDMKRAMAKKLIERYFYQLSDGCGNPKCGNKNCASSGGVESLSPNQAAARAIQLYTQEAELCELHPSKVARTDSAGGGTPHADCGGSDGATSSSNHGSTSGETSVATTSSSGTSKDVLINSSQSQNHSTTTATTTIDQKPDEQSFLDETKINQLLDECKQINSYSPLIRNLGKYFSSRDSVAHSFQKMRSAHIDAILEKAPKDLKNLKKEDFRILEGDLDKDEDSCADKEQPPQPHHITVDLLSLRRSMQKLYETHSAAFESLNIAFHSLAISLTVDLRLTTQKQQIEEIITVFVIMFEIVIVSSSEFVEFALPAICHAASFLPTWAQARLAWIWAEHCKSSIKNILQTIQQLVSLQVIAASDHQNAYVQDNETVVWATKVMKIVYYANILAGHLESSKLRDDDDDTSMSVIPEDETFTGFSSKQSKSTIVEDTLATELNVNILDCRKPFLSYEEFYNEPLSDAIEMDNDYLNYKNRRVESKKFSFMLYSFILTPATKTLALYYDNRIRMYSERRLSIYHTQLAGQPPNPYLKLRVRRDHIIDDALVELEVIAMGIPKDLKKQLVVEFVGEQGIDEGGVSKEFFQLVVEQIFNPDYGMFIHQEESNTVWFNSTSFENEAQFTLIGIVLGLAIYNNIILAVNFPMVVYRKLMGVKGSFADMEDFNPVLHKSLMSMLNYQEVDMEEVFMQTFKISYTDVFGNVMTHELKPNGDSVMVNQDNKQDFADLYTDYLLNSSIDKQFRAFRRGFQMVTDESPLHLLFRPEEIELLVCGSKQFDFNELEKATEYEGGYTDKSQTIIDFWEIVHALPMESKRKLLEFTTGSDRVPVGGLSRLKLVIARNGPDSDRLPTSHTCFNVLLLPEYADKQKLEDRLQKAINYSKGFGML